MNRFCQHNSITSVQDAVPQLYKTAVENKTKAQLKMAMVQIRGLESSVKCFALSL